MTRPPTLPLLAPGEAEWTEVQRVWAGTDDVEPRLAALRPFLAEAVRSVSIKQDLLLDEVWVSLLVGARVVRRHQLPSSARVMQLHLASAVLRVVADEQSVLTSRLHDPMAAWHAFRHRVNRLRRSFRRYLLASLPRQGSMPGLDVQPRRSPTAHWNRLWDQIAGGIPEGCLPVEWCRVRCDAINQDTTESVDSALPPGHALSPRRDWVEVLAKPLHRAAALLESRRAAKVDLILPDGVIPDRPSTFAEETLQGLKNFGDLPSGNQELESAILMLERLANPSIGLSATPISSMRLATLAHRMGFSAYKTGMLLGIMEERAGNPEAALWPMHMGLRGAASRREVSIALSNMAVQAVLSGSPQEAAAFARESLRYSSASPMARKNALAIQEILMRNSFVEGEGGDVD